MKTQTVRHRSQGYLWCWNTYGPAKPGDKPRGPWAEAWRQATGKASKPETRGAKSKESKATQKKTSASDAQEYSPGNIESKAKAQWD